MIDLESVYFSNKRFEYFSNPLMEYCSVLSLLVVLPTCSVVNLGSLFIFCNNLRNPSASSLF